MKMSSPQVAEYFKHSDTVLLAIGSIENHGYHNILGVDTLAPERILELIEEKSNVLIAPTMPYGAADSLLGFPGTVSIGQEALCAVVDKIVESLYMCGAKKILFINGHGGNIGALERVGLEWYHKGVITATLNWWTMVSGLNPDWKSGHGGAVETSAMMYIDPLLVDLSKVREMELKNDLGEELPSISFRTVEYKGVQVAVNRPVASHTDNGWVGDFDHPSGSSAKYGEDMLTAVADYILDFIEIFKKVKI